VALFDCRGNPFFGGIFCANGIIGEYKKEKKISERLDHLSGKDFSS
jgi:hypothetical protein